MFRQFLVIRDRRFVWLCLRALAPLVAIFAMSVSSAAASTFTPAADAYVDASLPDTNFGKKTSISVDASPVVVGYVRFSVSGVGSTSSARLRVYADTSNSKGFEVRPVADTTWGETTINGSNAPTRGAVIGTSGPVTAGVWYTVDVSSAVSGDGVYSFALTTVSGTATRYSSREGAHPAQLVAPVDLTPLSPIVVDHA